MKTLIGLAFLDVFKIFDLAAFVSKLFDLVAFASMSDCFFEVSL